MRRQKKLYTQQTICHAIINDIPIHVMNKARVQEVQAIQKDMKLDNFEINYIVHTDNLTAKIEEEPREEHFIKRAYRRLREANKDSGI